MKTDIRGPLFGVASQCEPILRGLPDWFGIDTAVQAYAETVNKLPTFLADCDQQVVGFISVKQHNPYAAELYVLGVRCDLHRRGIGRQLLSAAETWMHEVGIEYAYLKMLGPSCQSEPYERTRRFYMACGYRPLEEFKNFWAHDPCQIMVKRMGREA